MSSTSGSAGTAVSTYQEVSRSLSCQLHQMTQPLAVLQGVLELALVNSRTADEYRRAVQLALAELERATTCFEDLRALIERASADQNSGVKHV